MKHLCLLGTSMPLSKVSTSMIDSYREYCIHNKMKPDGININLRAVKTLFNWCHKSDLIKKISLLIWYLNQKSYLSISLIDYLMS